MSELQEILDKDASAKDFIDDFLQSKDPKFNGKSASKRREMAIAAYYVKQRESVEDTEEESLTEALRSRKSYQTMHDYLDRFHSKTMDPATTMDIIKNGAGNNDRFHDDYARHALLFHRNLSDDTLDNIASDIANKPKSTNELDKNFQKNVHSVGVLRAALRNGAADNILAAKRHITADHKNAIFAHGSDDEKNFILHHGLANKTQLSDAINNGSENVRATALAHLQSLKDAGSEKHADLIAQHLPSDREPSFIDRAAAKFSSAISGVKKTAADIMAKRAAANAPRKRITPSFDTSHMMGLNLPKNRALTVENITEELFDSIAVDDLVSASEQLQIALSAKVAERLESMRQDIAQDMFQNEAVKYAAGKWHVIDSANGGGYKNTIHSTHDTHRKAINAAREANKNDPEGNRYHAKAASACTSTSDHTCEGIVEEGMRLVATHTSTDGKKVAKVYRDSDWDEYRVKHYSNGKYLEDGDYHTTDKDDAHGTAKHYIKEGIVEEESPEKFAHFFGSKVKGYKIQITDSMQPIGGKTFPVESKAHAKQIAKQHNAKPWNF